jgi:VIT1/CCC1 family predicted Fe2+/Mn2+ transporter
MAAGEYVSVHSQADTEEAELKLERAELKADDKGEHKELMAIYVDRGLDPALARQVAVDCWHRVAVRNCGLGGPIGRLRSHVPSSTAWQSSP